LPSGDGAGEETAEVTLTGLPLLITGVVMTLVLAVGTGLLWWRSGRVTRHVRLVRAVLRPLALLLTEAAAVATVAVAANRALEIYPSWSVLFGGVHTVEKAATAPSAGLEEWLHSQADQGRDNGLSFSWKPAEAAAWHLPAAPVLAVPAAYFRDPVARFPVIVVIGPRHAGAPAAGWDDRRALQVARPGGPAVVVFVRLDDPAGALPTLSKTLPDQLSHDLRVLPGSWAVAGVGPDQTLALDLLHDSGDRYRTAALVGDGDRGPAVPLVDRARHLPAGLDLLVVAASPAGAGLLSDTVPHPAARLTAALHWIQQHTPPPLATPVVDPTAPATGGPHE
jgi:hypothetical protein